MKLKLFILMLLLFVLTPFSIEARDYDRKKCCYVCAEWIEKHGKFVRCIKYEMKCPCPYNPTPAFGGHNDIIQAGIVPDGIIEKIPKSWKQRGLDLFSRYFYLLGILPMVWLMKDVFWRRR